VENETLVSVLRRESTVYVLVPTSDRTKAEQAAFRYVYKRREKDFQELMETTIVVKVHHTLSVDTMECMGSHMR
jgi:hypothetical protein